jgi:hypothetical protein
MLLLHWSPWDCCSDLRSPLESVVVNFGLLESAVAPFGLRESAVTPFGLLESVVTFGLLESVVAPFGLQCCGSLWSPRECCDSL